MKNCFLILLLFTCLNLKSQVIATNFITGLPLPTCFTIAPDGRFFVSCKGFSTTYPSVLKVYSSTGIFQNDFWDFSDSANTAGEKGVLGVATDVNFLSNHYVYVLYNHLSPSKIRVVRFTEAGGIGTNPLIILDLDDGYAADYHTAGNIHTRISDPTHLYVSIGDKGVSSGAQDTTTWNGKLLRIGTDGSIPNDNPFYDDGDPGTGHDDRIWVIGLRNSFDFCFSPINDSLYASENGVSTYDELNMLTQGKNYGWPFCEGTAGTCAGFEPPIEIFGAAVPALTGIIVYSSTLMPEITNHVLIVDYNGGHINDVVLGNAPYYNQFVSRTVLSGTSFLNLTDIEQGPDGCIYVNEINAGRISKICSLSAIKEVSTQKLFSVFPNPAVDKITVEGEKVDELKLYNAGGELLLVKKQNQLDISGFPTGMYTLLVNGIYAFKITHLE